MHFLKKNVQNENNKKRYLKELFITKKDYVQIVKNHGTIKDASFRD